MGLQGPRIPILLTVNRVKIRSKAIVFCLSILQMVSHWIHMKLLCSLEILLQVFFYPE